MKEGKKIRSVCVAGGGVADSLSWSGTLLAGGRRGQGLGALLPGRCGRGGERRASSKGELRQQL
ncbi:hypothetical protein E2C01_073698 [Portunus trituberculatus]|uniref:Uncharacterized protein n=1 Tax=Portunus trituberculatus TaxID=210409 RepID=A0A5B7IEK9_PORTR|nr:hypothetical protein [Portunus trituberculatus]